MRQCQRKPKAKKRYRKRLTVEANGFIFIYMKTATLLAILLAALATGNAAMPPKTFKTDTTQEIG